MFHLLFKFLIMRLPNQIKRLTFLAYFYNMVKTEGNTNLFSLSYFFFLKMSVPMEYQSVNQTNLPDGTCSNTFMEILF